MSSTTDKKTSTKQPSTEQKPKRKAKRTPTTSPVTFMNFVKRLEGKVDNVFDLGDDLKALKSKFMIRNEGRKILSQVTHTAIKSLFNFAHEMAESESRVTILEKDMLATCRIFLEKYDKENKDQTLKVIDETLLKFISLSGRDVKYKTISSRLDLVIPSSRIETQARNTCGKNTRIPKSVVVIATTCLEEFIKSIIYDAAFKALQGFNTTNPTKKYVNGRVKPKNEWKAPEKSLSIHVDDVINALKEFGTKKEIQNFVTFNRANVLFTRKKRKVARTGENSDEELEGELEGEPETKKSRDVLD